MTPSTDVDHAPLLIAARRNWIKPLHRPRARLCISLASIACATSLLAGCGNKGAPSCEEVGRRLGELQVVEKHGHLATFLTDGEREAEAEQWIARCKNANPSASERRCIISAANLTAATACADGAAPVPSPADEDQVPYDGPFATRWVGGWGDLGDEATGGVAVAPDGDVIAAGWFDGDFRMAEQELSSAGDDDVWLARFSPTGSLRWARSVGGDTRDHVWGVAVGRDGAIVVAMDSSGEVDYGAGTAYLDALRDTGLLHGPMVLVTLASDGTAPAARALSIGGNAESIAPLADGSFVVGARAPNQSRGGVGDARCPINSFVVARLGPDGAPAWLRCNDPSPSPRFADIGGNARVAVGPEDTVAFCAGFHGNLAWAGQPSPESRDRRSRAFVMSLDAKGEIRWVRYAAGHVACEGLATAGDGSVAAILDEYPSPSRVVLEDGVETDGPALAAWDKAGALRWSRTCGEIFGTRCSITTVIGRDSELIVAADAEKGTIVAALATADGSVLRSRVIERGTSIEHLAAGPDGVAFGSSFRGVIDLGTGPIDSAAGASPGKSDLLIGVLEP